MSIDFEITKDAIIADVLQEHPECVQVFNKHDMQCINCMGATIEAVFEGALMHDVELEGLLNELNDCLKSSGN